MNRSLFLLDAILLTLFVIVMLPHATGIALHEWISYLFLFPFLLHLLFHWNWIVKIPSRLFRSPVGDVYVNIVLDGLLYFTMIFAIVSGVLASEVSLRGLGFNFTPDPFWSITHHQLSNLLFPLVGVHLAMHWGWIIRVAKQLTR